MLALALTLGVEVPIVAALYPGQRARLAVIAAFASTATHLTLHFALPRLVPAAQVMLLGEALALLGEALAYGVLSRPRDLGRALVASALANAASFGLGILVFGGR